jgi:hypothetical protein
MQWRVDSAPKAKKTITSSERLGFPNLWTTPYLRGRLVFAELVARVMQERTFDRVLVDLPSFMNQPGWLRFPLRLFPLLSSLVVRLGAKKSAFFPFMPVDAACLSAYLAWKRSIPLECVDDSQVLQLPEGYLFQPRLQLPDDYFLWSDGVDDYFGTIQRQMDAAWKTAPAVQKTFTEGRAGIVAERVRKHVNAGERVLFVCEHHLWWAVQRQLQGVVEPSGDTPASRSPWRDVKAAFLVEDPYLVWARGLFDDFPCVNARFFDWVVQGAIAPFDKLDELAEILDELVSGKTVPQTRPPSLRSLMVLRRYLANRVTTAQRVTPLPAVHLFESISACTGRLFAKEAVGELLKYPMPTVLQAAQPDPTFFVITPDGLTFAAQPFDPPDVFHSKPAHWPSDAEQGKFCPWDDERERRKWVDLVHRHISRQEWKEMGKRGGAVRWAIEYDYRLHETACSHLRYVIDRRSREFVVERSWGGLKDGIDWKATLSARARGEAALYARRRVFRRGLGRLDEHTPSVFLFSENVEGNRGSTVHDSNLTQRRLELYGEQPTPDAPPADCVYSVFMTSEKCDYLFEDDVQCEHLTSIAFLYSKHWMGLDRYAAINRRPVQFQCRVGPDWDPELDQFGVAERGLAWAIKYAQRTVLVAAAPGWRPSARIAEFAATRGVQIRVVPLSIFSEAMLDRLRRIHFISTRLKRYRGRDQVVKRFLN